MSDAEYVDTRRVGIGAHLTVVTCETSLPLAFLLSLVAFTNIGPNDTESKSI